MLEGNISERIAWPTGQHEEVRARIAMHRKLDEIVQGIGWAGGRGCAIGCSLDGYDHAEYARVLGIPSEVAHLVDYIHESLPRELALDWPGRVANALQPGTETTHMWPRFAIWLLREACPPEESKVVDVVIDLYERRIAGDEASPEEWANADILAETSWLKEGEPVAAIARAIMATRVIWATEWAAEEGLVSFLRQADALIEILSTGIKL